MLTELNLNGYNESRYLFAAKKSDFEPFYVRENGFENKPEPNNYRFINRYDGPYTQQMLLNRNAVERFIRFGGFEGAITLAQLPYFLEKIEEKVNPDGSVTATRVDIFTTDRKPLSHEEVNPYYKVTATPEGWNIGINGKRINNEISQNPPKSLTREELFTKRFNGLLSKGLSDCLRREKFSDEKNPLYSIQRVLSITPPLICSPLLFYQAYSAVKQFTLDNTAHSYSMDTSMILYFLALTVTGWTLFNMVSQGTINKDDSKWMRQPKEFMLPPIRIEDWIVGETYLALKGRELVKLKP